MPQQDFAFIRINRSSPHKNPEAEVQLSGEEDAPVVRMGARKRQKAVVTDSDGDDDDLPVIPFNSTHSTAAKDPQADDDNDEEGDGIDWLKYDSSSKGKKKRAKSAANSNIAAILKEHSSVMSREKSIAMDELEPFKSFTPTSIDDDDDDDDNGDGQSSDGGGNGDRSIETLKRNQQSTGKRKSLIRTVNFKRFLIPEGSPLSLAESRLNAYELMEIVNRENVADVCHCFQATSSFQSPFGLVMDALARCGLDYIQNPAVKPGASAVEIDHSSELRVLSFTLLIMQECLIKCPCDDVPLLALILKGLVFVGIDSETRDLVPIVYKCIMILSRRPAGILKSIATAFCDSLDVGTEIQLPVVAIIPKSRLKRCVAGEYFCRNLGQTVDFQNPSSILSALQNHSVFQVNSQTDFGKMRDYLKLLWNAIDFPDVPGSGWRPLLDFMASQNTRVKDPRAAFIDRTEVKNLLLQFEQLLH